MKLFDRLIIDSDEEEMKEDFNSHRSCDFFKKKKEKKKEKESHSHTNRNPQSVITSISANSPQKQQQICQEMDSD